MVDLKCCEKVEDLEKLCPTCKAEYERYLDEQAEVARIQEIYEAS